MYSEVVKDHFKNPRNVGEIDNADGIGEIGNPVCGDMMNISIKVEDNIIKDIKFLTFGCGAAIAVSSMLTEMAKGKTLEEAKKITNKDVAEALEGLPNNKLHCSNLGADALQIAIKDYENRQAGEAGNESSLAGKEHAHQREGQCHCPYCDAEVPDEAEYCTNCSQPIEIEE